MKRKIDYLHYQQVLEGKYRSLIESQGGAFAAVDLDERFIFSGHSADIIFGVPEGGLAERSVYDFVVPDLACRFPKAW